MKYETKVKIAREAVLKFGRETQTLKAIEELNELSRALARDLAMGATHMEKINVCEEIADVEIMLTQLWYLYDTDEIEEWKDSKLERLARMVGVEIGEDNA